MTQAQQHEARELYLDRTFDGMLSVNGRLDREAGDVLLTAIGARRTPPPERHRQPRITRATCRCPRRAARPHRPRHRRDRPPPRVRRQHQPHHHRRPSQVLDVGRRTRTISPALRRALVVRDAGCVHPGCDRPPSWCEGHHLRHWVDGGTTDLANLILLCRRHHRAQHEGGRALQHRADQGKADRNGYYDTYRTRATTATHCATCRPLPHHPPRRTAAPQPGPNDPF